MEGITPKLPQNQSLLLFNIIFQLVRDVAQGSIPMHFRHMYIQRVKRYS